MIKVTTALLSLAAILFAGSTLAVEIKSTGNGNWTNTATWNSGTVPAIADRALIIFDNTVTVDSPSNQVGSLRLDAGKAFLNIETGGALTVVNSGTYPTNGSVSFKWAGTPCTINVQGGDFTVQGNTELDGGNAGVTNMFNVTSGSIDLSSYFEIGDAGAGGLSLVAVIGADASFRVGGNMKIGASAILGWTPAEDGAVTAMVSDNFKNVILLGGTLLVDMTGMKGRPAEIMLIDNNGPDAIDGTFATTNLIGNSDYVVSYTGGDGNDLVLSNVAPVLASSQLITGWTRAQTFPSEKTPAENGLKVRVDEIDNSGTASKFDRGSSDMTYGSGLFTNVADEAVFHGSTSCYTLAVDDALRVVITNGYGANGLIFQLDYVLGDWTAPFAQSPKTLNVKYIEGDLGIPTNTLLTSDFMFNSGATTFTNYADVDASLTGYDVADRTLTNGQYAVFEITVSTNVFGSDGACYIDNIALAATITTNETLSGYEEWAADYPTLVGGEQDDDDGDGLLNIEEFGLGGDPTNSADIGYVPTLGTALASGTNWFEYIHVQRTSANNDLTYYLEQDDNLVVAPGWTNSGDYIVVGTNSMPSDADFEAVTNWISTEGKSAEFIQLIIE
ncbi:hypothetical protein [Pontiella sulfatireligans]|uniref:Uncharacterized protein n=1 Tax=Pontiella sulfatireligans TaxID=2750658 RepID=A0A6C2URM3_9BACT|nr:hypothetical protein [Pontiella sulfatireligans]VGO21877.1 hypothetical protein SCARR_03957 [Pontiella sulfatireligans]